MTATIERIELGDRRIKDFARVPWELFRGDPLWTPPLRAELLGNRLLGMVDLFTPDYPFHRDADVTHSLARDGKRLLG